MNTPDFLMRLLERYPKFDSGSFAKTLQDIRELIEEIDDAGRVAVFSELRDTYDRTTPPTRATIYAIVQRLSLTRRRSGVVTRYVLVCHHKNANGQECLNRMSIEALVCIKCGTKTGARECSAQPGSLTA